jgi:hypothetical protein
MATPVTSIGAGTSTSAWDQALGGNALARDVCSKPLVFERIQFCEAVCAENNYAAPGWRTWAFDLPSGDKGGAPKRYIAATVEAFCAGYSKLEADKRNVYEVIDAALPCWPYFDLEFTRSGGLNADKNGDALSDAVVEAAVAELREQLTLAREQHERSGSAVASSLLTAHADGARVAADTAAVTGVLEVEVIALDSHRADKYSRHLILRPHLVLRGTAAGSSMDDELRLPLCLEGSAAAKNLAQATCIRLKGQIDVEIAGAQSSVAAAAARPTSGGGTGAVGSFVDLAVYTKRRCFRLVGSCKIGSASGALTVNDAACHSLPDHLTSGMPFSRRTLSEQVRHTLVVPELPPPSRLHPLAPPAWLTLSFPEKAVVVQASPQEGHQHQGRRMPAVVVQAGHAVDTDAPNGADDRERWLSSIDGVTDTPLLDLPRTKHPFIAFCFHSPSAMPPRPFMALAEWAVKEFGRWGTERHGARAGCAVKGWTYVRAEHPPEALLHLVATGTRYCFGRGRQHKSQAVMLTVNLLTGTAWQRCYDVDCIEYSGGVALKAKHRVGLVPFGTLPTHVDRASFERANDRHHAARVDDHDDAHGE